MSGIKIHLDSNYEGEITCPQCGKTKPVTVTPEQIFKPTTNLQCECGHSFDVAFERRKFKRKDVRILGKIYDVKSNDFICEVTITSLSQSGLAFRVPFEKISLENFANDKLMEISFPYGGNRMTAREQIKIRYVIGCLVGAEFSQKQYDSDLDLYLSLTIPNTDRPTAVDGN